jgi:hypothetical protein
MADETVDPAESAEPEFRIIIGNEQEYHFATGAAVSKPQKMVYIDFFQVDPQSDPKIARAVSRVAMLPSVAKQLFEQLSKLGIDDAEIAG